MREGRIKKALSGFYYVETDGEILQCRARGKFRKEGLSPLVGGGVELRGLGTGAGFVEAVKPRKNAFRRPAVANVDQIVVIASEALPKTDPYLIDRLSAIAALKGCGVVVALNKCDLNSADSLYRVYRAAGFPTVRVSAETGEGLEELKPLISEKLSAFTGLSYQKLGIGSAASRWGSCNGKNEIRLSWRLVLLPEELIQYVVIHELCHTAEHNHSAAFWRKVSYYLPDYASLRHRLRTFERTYQAQINWP